MVWLWWLLWIWVAWWHDDGSSSLHYSDHISGYCILSLIRQFGQLSSNAYKVILDGVGWLLNKLYWPFFIGGIRVHTICGVYAPIKRFRSLDLDMTCFVAIFFAVTFSPSYFSVLFSATCLYCSNLTALRKIPEVESGFLLLLNWNNVDRWLRIVLKSKREKR